VNMIEDFLQKCDGMVVLLSWQYFERLWWYGASHYFPCAQRRRFVASPPDPPSSVYEWASFLICHDPKNVTICVDAFLRPSTRALYVQSIENFSVANSKCNKEADRPVLAKKVAEYYNSVEAFEYFTRSTSIGVMALAVARKAARGSHEEEFMPWVHLARRLGLTDLAAGLETCQPASYRKIAIEMSKDENNSNKWQKIFADKLEEWFDSEIAPVLEAARLQSVRPEHHHLVKHVAMAAQQRRRGPLRRMSTYGGGGSSQLSAGELAAMLGAGAGAGPAAPGPCAAKGDEQGFDEKGEGEVAVSG